MLTYIKVDGFRSLSDFEMYTKPGLNILVGPNGSGKSNIIGFFQFLSRVMRTNLSDAVSFSGGVGAFFQKVGEQSFKNEISVTLRGQTLTSGYDVAREKVRDHFWIQYEYSFAIQASERFDSIVFSTQGLYIKRIDCSHKKRPQYEDLRSDEDWDVVLKSRAEPASVSVQRFNDDLIKLMRYARHPEKDRSMQQILLEYLQEEEIGLQSNSLVVVASRPLDVVSDIIDDLRGGETLNINPSKVKEPEDSARIPGIISDGSGLAATIWHMTHEPDYPRNLRYSPFYFPVQRKVRWPKEVYTQIQDFVRLINSEIENIFVDNDRFENQLKIKMRMSSKAGSIDLPLSAMSDGTIKWMSLITAILTSGKIFAIEEPENFLHPLMLIEILKLMRSTTADKFSFAIMTTHSETLLNAAIPEEIVVVSMESGITRGRRPSDPVMLAKEIQETGFGLGHYYLVGALADA